MSTNNENKQKIEEMLTKLNEDSLNRSHNSVNISFAEMQNYINKIPETGLSDEIKKLLQAYREMAEIFYTQFEISLLNEIEKQRNIKHQAGQIGGKIENLETLEKGELETVDSLLTVASKNADIALEDLIKNFPTLLQTALDKLKDEWQRLNTLAVSSQSLNRDEQLFRTLETVVKAAAYSVAIETDQIVIVPGNSFALYFFSYMKNFAVLTVPIHSVRAPWEWSIFWHELAGYKVRQLKNSKTIDEIRGKLRDFHNRFKDGDNEKQEELQKLIKEITHHNQGHIDDSEWTNKFTQNYLSTIFSRKSLILSDLGSFEYQYERMLINLKIKDKFQKYDDIKHEGWCVDWFEELFEDAFSVLTIREPFLEFFKDILSRHQTVDGRHPPMKVRVQVAKELLNLMNSDGDPDKPGTIEQSAAQQILKSISLLMVASLHIEEQDNFNQIIERNIIRLVLPDGVGIEIGKSIIKWSDNFLKAKDRVKNARKEAEDFINFSSEVSLGWFMSEFEKMEKKPILPSYEELFKVNGKDKDYKELLLTPFFDVDFATAEVTDVYYNTTLKFSSAKLQSLPSDVVMGAVKYTRIENNSGVPHTTSLNNWNIAAGVNSNYHISAT